MGPLRLQILMPGREREKNKACDLENMVAQLTDQLQRMAPERAANKALLQRHSLLEEKLSERNLELAQVCHRRPLGLNRYRIVGSFICAGVRAETSLQAGPVVCLHSVESGLGPIGTY